MKSLEALQAKVGTLSLEAQTKLEADAVAKEAKAERKADAALKKKMVSSQRILMFFYTHPHVEGVTSRVTQILS